MTSSTEPVILYDVDEQGVAVLTLNRPKVLNAFNTEMVKLWHELLVRADNDDAVKVVVVTGKGRAFCAGGDFDHILEFRGKPASEFKSFLWDNIHHIAKTLDRMEKPVIAGLNGTARGAGLDMALMCDIRIAGESVVMAESYINLNLVAGDGGTYFLPRLIGTARALELFWTGREVGAAEAERIGMINRMVPDADLLAETMKLAHQIAARPQQAVKAFKRMVYHGPENLAGHLDMLSSQMAVLVQTPEHDAAMDAFVVERAERRRKKSS